MGMPISDDQSGTEEQYQINGNYAQVRVSKNIIKKFQQGFYEPVCILNYFLF